MKILLILFCLQDFGGENDKQFPVSILDQLMVTRKTLRLACEKIKHIISHSSAIDALIIKFLKNYDFNRISHIERNILRLGTFEMLFDDNVPPKVAISEAIRLNRKFGTPEGGAFVNAILDTIYLSKECLCSSKTTLKEVGV